MVATATPKVVRRLAVACMVETPRKEEREPCRILAGNPALWGGRRATGETLTGLLGKARPDPFDRGGNHASPSFGIPHNGGWRFTHGERTIPASGWGEWFFRTVKAREGGAGPCTRGAEASPSAGWSPRGRGRHPGWMP